MYDPKQISYTKAEYDKLRAELRSANDGVAHGNEVIEDLVAKNKRLRNLLQEVAINLDSLANKKTADWPKWAENTIDNIGQALKGGDTIMK